MKKYVLALSILVLGQSSNSFAGTLAKALDGWIGIKISKLRIADDSFNVGSIISGSEICRNSVQDEKKKPTEVEGANISMRVAGSDIAGDAATLLGLDNGATSAIQAIDYTTTETRYAEADDGDLFEALKSERDASCKISIAPQTSMVIREMTANISVALELRQGANAAALVKKIQSSLGPKFVVAAAQQNGVSAIGIGSADRAILGLRTRPVGKDFVALLKKN